MNNRLQLNDSAHVLSSWCHPLGFASTCACGNDDELVFPPPDFSSAAQVAAKYSVPSVSQ